MLLTVRHNKKIERALKKKRIYEDTDVKTYLSHGSKDYGDQLLFKLSQQMHLTKKELLKFIDGEMSQEEYEEILKIKGIL